MNQPAALTLAALAALAVPASAQDAAAAPRRPPNVVLIFVDDMGYGDLSCAGHPTIHTPRLDALASGGRRFSQFYVASPVCSPSRAALLTGCYPKRVSMHEHVIFPGYDHGLHPDEVTLAEVLRARGYATACFGKWHLGHRRGLLPPDQGFDEYFGIPYSNDMAQFHRRAGNEYGFRLPLLRGRGGGECEVVEWEPDQHELTRRLTEAAVQFVAANADRPFFLYVPHPMPHIPIYASAAFADRSPRGRYGDVIEELDASVGSIVDALAARGLTDDTLVLFASDNGPWKPMRQDGGSAGPLRGGKGTNWEGGQRVPLIASWPGRVPAGSMCREVVTAMDVVPTVAALCGATPPQDRVLDGHDVSALLLGEAGAESPTETFLYYAAKGPLAGIRRGPWKLLLDGDQLFHLEHDISEEWDASKKRPELVAELRALALALDAEISEHARPVLRGAPEVFDPRRPQ